MTPEEKARYRQERAKPILTGIFEKLEEVRWKPLPKDKRGIILINND